VLRDDGVGRWRAVTANARDRARLACRAGQQRAVWTRARQQRAVWTRARQQPAAAFELLALLALLGRPAPARLLAAASGGGDDDVLADVHQLGRVALVRHDPAGFSTSHDLVAETVRERLDPVDRARLHQPLARALTGARSGPVRSRLLSRLAALASGAEDLVHAATLVEVALAEAGDDPAARARALYVGALVDMNLEQGGRAADRFAETQALFARVADARGVADILDARAMGGFLDGDVTGAVDAFDRVAALFADAGNLLRVVTPRSTRGHALLFAGRTGDALADVQPALELARALGYAEGEAMVRWHLSETLAAAGRVTEVAEAAWRIADRVGHRGWTATAWLARGVAAAACGDLDGADAAFRRALATSDHLPLFACWAGARLARVLAARGALDEAAALAASASAWGGWRPWTRPSADRCTATGPPARSRVMRAAWPGAPWRARCAACSGRGPRGRSPRARRRRAAPRRGCTRRSSRPRGRRGTGRSRGRSARRGSR
jgi:tetratricopeptide (TPR) repeat protein